MNDHMDPERLLRREREVLAQWLGLDPGAERPWPRLDVNTVDAGLLHALGFDPDDIRALREGRPYYALRDAAQHLSPRGVRQLRRLLTVAPLQLPGGGETLRPSADQWLDAPAHALAAGSAAESPASSTGSRRSADGPRYARFKRRRIGALEVESQQVSAFPTLVDARGNERPLDPRFVVVQADRPADDPALLQTLRLLDLHLHQLVVPDPALMILRLGSDRHGLAGLSQVLLALQGVPGVELAEPAWLGFDDLEECQAAVEPPVLPAPDSSGLPWNLLLMGAAPQLPLDAGHPQVCLAMVDTGMDAAHAALAPPPGSSATRTGEDLSPDPGDGGGDAHGHGTAVAGVLVAQRAAPFWGLTPGCSLWSLRVPMFASLESYALRRAALLRLRDQARSGQRLVVNLSWRTAGDVALIRTAVAELLQAGAVVVASAGNAGQVQGPAHYPSDYPGVWSIAALAPDGSAAPYSNRNTRVDFAAPGGVAEQPLWCVWPGGQGQGQIGTSFAAPHVAALAAWLWSHFPNEDRAGLYQRLRSVCVPCGADMGNGLPSLPALVALLPGVPDMPGHPGSPEPEPGPAPDIAPDPAIWRWPVEAERLLQVVQGGCGLKAITQRVMRARGYLQGWTEVQALLGMDAQALHCLRQHVPGLP